MAGGRSWNLAAIEMLQVCATPQARTPFTHTHTPRVNFDSPATPVWLGLWEEAGEKTHAEAGRACRLHTERGTPPRIYTHIFSGRLDTWSITSLIKNHRFAAQRVIWMIPSVLVSSLTFRTRRLFRLQSQPLTGAKDTSNDRFLHVANRCAAIG